MDQNNLRMGYGYEQFVVVVVLWDLGCPPGLYNQIVCIHIYKQQTLFTYDIWFHLPLYAYLIQLKC